MRSRADLDHARPQAFDQLEKRPLLRPVALGQNRLASGRDDDRGRGDRDLRIVRCEGKLVRAALFVRHEVEQLEWLESEEAMGDADRERDGLKRPERASLDGHPGAGQRRRKVDQGDERATRENDPSLSSWRRWQRRPRRTPAAEVDRLPVPSIAPRQAASSQNDDTRLPRLWNLLHGKMTLVGPRLPLPADRPAGRSRNSIGWVGRVSSISTNGAAAQSHDHRADRPRYDHR